MNRNSHLIFSFPFYLFLKSSTPLQFNPFTADHIYLSKTFSIPITVTPGFAFLLQILFLHNAHL